MRKRIYQKGAVLVIGLLMLTVMTLIAVSSMQSSGLQTLMSSNMQDEVTAFEAAETALRAAEEFLDTGLLNLNAFDTDASDGLLANLYDQVWEPGIINWQSEGAVVENIADYNEKGGVRTKPRYVIQYLGPVAPDAETNLNVGSSYAEGRIESVIEMFKITARGTGGTDNSVVVLESVYGVSN